MKFHLAVVSSHGAVQAQGALMEFVQHAACHGINRRFYQLRRVGKVCMPIQKLFLNYTDTLIERKCHGFIKVLRGVMKIHENYF